MMLKILRCLRMVPIAVFVLVAVLGQSTADNAEKPQCSAEREQAAGEPSGVAMLQRQASKFPAPPPSEREGLEEKSHVSDDAWGVATTRLDSVSRLSMPNLLEHSTFNEHPKQDVKGEKKLLAKETEAADKAKKSKSVDEDEDEESVKKGKAKAKGKGKAKGKEKKEEDDAETELADLEKKIATYEKYEKEKKADKDDEEEDEKAGKKAEKKKESDKKKKEDDEEEEEKAGKKAEKKKESDKKKKEDDAEEEEKAGKKTEKKKESDKENDKEKKEKKADGKGNQDNDLKKGKEEAKDTKKKEKTSSADVNAAEEVEKGNKQKPLMATELSAEVVSKKESVEESVEESDDFKKAGGKQKFVVSGDGVPLSETGYFAIAALRNHNQMKSFIQRVAVDMGIKIVDESNLHGFVKYYSGEKAVQDMNKLRKEMKTIISKRGMWMVKKGDQASEKLFLTQKQIQEEEEAKKKLKKREEEAKERLQKLKKKEKKL